LRVEITPEKINGEFATKVADLSGQNVRLCYQCGKCSAGCPMAFVMDLLPNQVIRLVQLGLAEDLEESETAWLCASCFACSVRCPKGIDIARVMEAVRQLSLRKSRDHVDVASLAPDRLASLPQIALVSGFRKLTS
jgi:heterodisulfide reductase subunit C